MQCREVCQEGPIDAEPSPPHPIPPKVPIDDLAGVNLMHPIHRVFVAADFIAGSDAAVDRAVRMVAHDPLGSTALDAIPRSGRDLRVMS